MKGFWLHCCPRCGGDLLDVQDLGGAYVACLQCAHVLTARDEAFLRYMGHLPVVTTPPAEAGAA